MSGREIAFAFNAHTDTHPLVIITISGDWNGGSGGGGGGRGGAGGYVTLQE